MPNKTIYVSDSDLPLYQRAQELVGGNLSKAISTALRRFVEAEEGKLEGFSEITVKVGVGKTQRTRFVGVLLAEWGRSTKDRVEHYRVYQGRTGKFVVHTERSPETTWTAGADGKASGWRKYVASDQTWGTGAATSTVDVYETAADLEAHVPAELYALVKATADHAPVEDLDV
ncbi:EXLDI protein [Mumia zhuanghuii]|uniref:EXLDI protein n=2 Tax=Mumia TaxID=1546255 RepID=A0ABW1QLX0_9ACTN|nr:MULTISPECIES: EXLDI protein [Mumia]KAA1424892.1 EXLDI protein [Mumia zhuanghuii]